MKYFSEQNLDTKEYDLTKIQIEWLEYWDKKWVEHEKDPRYKWIPKEHFRGMQGFDQKLLSYVKEVIPVTDKLEDSETIETVSITEEELRNRNNGTNNKK